MFKQYRRKEIAERRIFISLLFELDLLDLFLREVSDYGLNKNNVKGLLLHFKECVIIVLILNVPIWRVIIHLKEYVIFWYVKDKILKRMDLLLKAMFALEVLNGWWKIIFASFAFFLA